MHVGTKEMVLVPGEVLCYYATQHLHSSDGAKQLAEICPEEWGGLLPGTAAGLIWQLSYLSRSWRSSESRMLNAVLLLVLDLFLFKVGRLLGPLNTPFYWWKNYSIGICEFLPQRRDQLFLQANLHSEVYPKPMACFHHCNSTFC